ncbi:che-14 [Pristionchus pacificus]|nr:che-14 [Pristionchus pacificus]
MTHHPWPIRAYSSFIYRYPLLVFIASLILTGFVPVAILYLQPPRLTPNAEVGFDTKGTDYSGARLAWQQLSITLQSSNRLLLKNNEHAIQPVRSRRGVADLDVITLRHVSSVLSQMGRPKRGWAEDLLAAITNIACYEAPIPLMNHLSQVILELPSVSSLFEITTVTAICQMQDEIKKELKAFDQFTPYRSIWSYPAYAACLSPNELTNCDQLTQNDLEMFRSLVTLCLPFRGTIMDCRLRNDHCNEIPKNCSSTMMFDLFYRIVPRDLTQTPIHINTFLPVFTLTGYATQNIRIPLHLYDHLESAIVNYTSSKGLVLRGLAMDVKRDRLLPSAIEDSFMALFSALLVLICVVIHSRSIGYALAVAVQLFLSVTCALAIYSFFTLEFPLLNLVTFVLLIAIASDDAFLLHSAMPDNLDDDSFEEALAHTGGTMFLTSFSTAVPFYLNCFSDVLVFRAFGLFAGTTMIINYLLVISFLPAFVLMQRRWCACLPSIPSVGSCFTQSIDRVLPWVLLKGRLLWLTSLSMMVVASVMLAVSNLHLPEYNPLQLFVSSNPHEWYDNHAEILYPFVEEKVAIPLATRLVFGVARENSSSHFDADSFKVLSHDPSFSLSSVSAIQHLASTLSRIRELPFVRHPHAFWPERFLEWSKTWPCSTGGVCCDVNSKGFANEWLDFCLRNSTVYLPTHYNDTPLFDNNTFALVGYTAMMPTQLRYSHRFSNLSGNIHKIEEGYGLLKGGWWTTEWYLMGTWFDLQRAVVSDIFTSTVVSMAVVAVFALVQLRLQSLAAVACFAAIIAVCVGIVAALGWVIGLLEAIILVLVVGLSFDYTLHYGASLPAKGCSSHRIETSLRRAVNPVSLAAFSSILAGAPMLFCKTHAFFQVGVFIVVLTSVSWLYSTFFFLPLLSFTLPTGESSGCPDCKQRIMPTSIPLNSKF